jgi:predicted membrane protein
MKLPQWSPMVVAVLMGWVYVGLAAVLISVLSDTRQAEALSASVAMMGAAIGWLLGVALSPYTRKEESSFTKYGAAVAAFGSGYLVARTDDLVKQILSSALTAVIGFRVALFVTAVLVSMLATHASRSYATNRPGRKQV